MSNVRRVTMIAVCMCVIAALACGTAVAQVGPTFSIDFQGPTAIGPGPGAGIPDGFGFGPIDEGQILTTTPPGPLGPNPPALPALAPLPPPGIMVDSVPFSPIGSVPGGLGIVPGIHGAVEVDALSYGRDFGRQLLFSVDEFAVGDVIAGPGPFPPNVFTEGAFGVLEASADVFRYLGPAVLTPPPPPPVPPLGANNTAVIDGDGFPPFGGPGTGLLEPNPPGPGPDVGDNLDALDVNTTLNDVKGPIFFSMDSNFPDPLEGFFPPVNSGTAAGNVDAVTGIPFVGGDVAVTAAGGLPTLYAPAGVLGLDLAIAGVIDVDDLDALALWDDGALNALGHPFFSAASDFILFSVRRNSAVIGLPDSLFGIPIEEGDVLSVPIVGGISPFPSMFIPAEALGLATIRSGTTGGMNLGDDLDALDVVPEPGTFVLLAIGLMGLLAYGGRRRRRNA